ncbi:MAG: guanylate kinase [Neisseria sp.]|nr:guanylate kinase [Neisseria sp.]
MSKQGNIFVISAASGTGKTSLTAELLKINPNVRVAVSHTTRAPRAGEINRQHYYFVDDATFEKMIGEGAFLEHAKVHNHYYGTSIMAVDSLRKAGHDVILEIDVQGATQIRYLLPEAVSIFILPPSLEVLRERLSARGTESAETLALRLSNARAEFEQASLFDYLVVNDVLTEAVLNLNHIIAAAHFLQTNNSEALTRLLQ